MFRTLRLSLRFLVPLFLALLGVAYLSVPLVDSLMQRWFVRDLDLRSALVARSFEEQVGELLESNSVARIDALLERAAADERLFALALCDVDGRLIRKTHSFPRRSIVRQPTRRQGRAWCSICRGGRSCRPRRWRGDEA
jgi:trehalose 6-phosphate synthase